MVSTGELNAFACVSATDMMVLPIDNNNDYKDTAKHCLIQNWHIQDPVGSATGGLLRFPSDHHDDESTMHHFPLFCGGWRSEEVFADKLCYWLGRSNQKAAGQLQEKRSGAASVVIDIDTDHGKESALWVTGGFADTMEALCTTEMVKIDPVDSSKVYSTNHHVRLEACAIGHCLEMIDRNLAILYGGYFHFRDTATIDINQHSPLWDTTRPKMSIGRLHHACGVARTSNGAGEWKYVVAAGGISEYDGIIDSVELLFVDSRNAVDDNWIAGPSLPVPLEAASGATAMDQSRLVVAGGVLFWTEDTMEYVASSNVFEFECVDRNVDSCQWTKLTFELATGRGYALAFILPPPPTAAFIEAEKLQAGKCSLLDKSRGKEEIVQSGRYQFYVLLND